MSTIINGTDNSATTPAITGSTGGTSTGVFYPASNQVALATNGTTAVTIDTSQNVGIGTASPTTQLSISKGSQGNNLNVRSRAYLGGTTSSDSLVLGYSVKADTGATDQMVGTETNSGGGAPAAILMNSGVMQFHTASSVTSGAAFSSERMRITSAGKVCVGVTSPLITGATLSLASGGDNTSLALKGDSGTNCGSIRYTSYTTGANRFQLASNENNWFLFNADATSYAYVGQSITSWSFGSDRRIKKDIVDLPYGLETILAIQPRKYKLLSNNSDDIGFVAQELKLVVPEAVEGEEIPYSDDDTNMERASKTMGVSKDKLIPILVKAIQELNAKVEAQATTIAELQAKVG
jgi:hypothetical protein